ncbi:MAG: IgGFc-binding protein [Tannerella sp.]|nr:IgGFc-binding protein [Tannerella sp.]
MNSTADATNVLPVDNLGANYYHISYHPSSAAYSDGYTVIAVKDGTHVFQNGVPVATLDSAQVYTAGFLNADSTGLHITSDNPIAYFVTNQLCMIPRQVSARDVLFQQLPPVNQWGTRFFVPNTKQQIGRIRIMASQDGTNITQVGATGPIVSDDGLDTGSQPNLEDLQAGQFVELEMEVDGCYITSNKPVGVVAYMVGNTYVSSDIYPSAADRADPSETWVAPIEQVMKNILIAPFIPAGTSSLKDHFALIVTPTKTKTQTTVAIGTNPSAVLTGVTWIDNAASGYSYCSYQLTSNSTYLFDNPKGLTVSGYGVGNIESYYYMSGSASRNLSVPFYINEIYYEDFNRSVVCDSIFHIEINGAISYDLSLDPGYLVWRLDGNELTAYEDQSVIDTILPVGHHELILMITPQADAVITYEVSFTVAPPTAVWTPENNPSSDANRQKWNDVRNWTPSVAVPTACMDVYIPGNSDYYPRLTNLAECNNIYFIQGAEVGRPDSLKYEKAHVQLNFGLLQTAQDTESGTALLDLVLQDNDTYDRLTFAASTSAPLDRERWYMLSAPLRNTVSGDFSFGGFPLTFMRKFGPVTKNGTSYPVGDWTDTYTTYKEVLSPTEGFAFYMYGYDPSGTGNRNRGCLEYGLIDDYNDPDYFPERTGGSYGIRNINGILEFPFYEDSLMLVSRRTQAYDGINTSTFHYMVDAEQSSLGGYNDIVAQNDRLIRESSGGSYHFTTEENQLGKWQFNNPVYHPGAGLGASDEFLVGNPYMSSINAVEFLKDNQSLLEPQYRIWNGTGFDSYSVNLTAGLITTPVAPDTLNYYIAPMQGFFLTTKSGYSGGDIAFDVKKISTVRPVTTASNLRTGNASTETNRLRIEAENEYASSRLLIVHQPDAQNTFRSGEDVQRLFSPYGYVPEVYSLAGEIPAEINFTDLTADGIIPLGIKTDYQGVIKLSFSGMAHFPQASKIEFVDAAANLTVDLTGKTDYSYEFSNQAEGIQNGRFFLRFQASPTALKDIKDFKDLKDLKIYSDDSGIHIASPDNIREITLYNLQGQKIYESGLINRNFYTIRREPGLPAPVVRAVTASGVKSVKLGLINN